jgi:chloramphenicol 3-O-phosphotransferase
VGSAKEREDAAAPSLMSTNCIFALGGPSKSGKTSVGRRFAEELALRFASFGDYVRKEATRRGIRNASSVDLQAVGLSLVTSDLVNFCQSVLIDAGFVRGEGLVIDGVRHLDTVRVLKRLFGEQPLRVIYLYSSLAVRRQRGSFTVDDLDRLDSHPVEAETQAVKNIADFVLDTSLLTPDDCIARLRSWVKQL